MYTSELIRKVFIEPFEQGADHLYIISAKATPTMATQLIALMSTYKRFANITLTVGMTGSEGIATTSHAGFVELSRQKLPDDKSVFLCSYIYQGAPIHSNIYVWTAEGKPLAAFAGTASFTQMNFSHNRREIMLPCDPEPAMEYINSLIGDSIYCYHQEIEEYIRLLPPREFNTEAEPSIKLSLLTKRTNDVGSRSGLNWGQRAGRERNQAYISVPASIARAGFFPLEATVFTVLTDDRHQLLMRVEQMGDKAITTPLSNAQLGEYFRNRLGLPNGAKVTKEDLLRYGRTDVTFIKIEEELFYMDFSV